MIVLLRKKRPWHCLADAGRQRLRGAFSVGQAVGAFCGSQCLADGRSSAHSGAESGRPSSATSFMGIGPFCLLLVLVCVAPLTARAEPLRTIVADVGLDQKLDAQIPLDVWVVDEQGKRVPLRSAFGKRPVVLNFVQYRCRMLCTQVLNGLLRSSQAVPFMLGKDYDIVTISIDPEETSKMAREKKRTYVGSYRRPGGEQGWHFFTADEQAIRQLTQAAGFRFRYDLASNQYAHPSGIILLTPSGRVSRYLYGIEYDPRDLRLGLVEASQHKIGGLVEQVLLLCFHYDPATGRYGFVIEGGIRVAGIATVLVLGGFLIRMFRLEQRRNRAARDAQASSLAVFP